VAQAGRIVMLSLHQPSEAMFDQLDRAFLMARGHLVYSGEPNAALPYFERAGLPCPEKTAIAEHMLAAVSDPAMLGTLLAHVHAYGPYAGVAAVRAVLCDWPMLGSECPAAPAVACKAADSTNPVGR
jgi:hypothetical protein